MSRTAEAPRRWPTLLVIGAQAALLIGLGLYALRFDPAAPLSEQAIVFLGPILVIGGTAAWWRWGSRLPLVLVDLWLVLYGLGLTMLLGAVDFGAAAPDLTIPTLIAALWVVGGIVGAVAVAKSRR